MPPNPGNAFVGHSGDIDESLGGPISAGFGSHRPQRSRLAEYSSTFKPGKKTSATRHPGRALRFPSTSVVVPVVIPVRIPVVPISVSIAITIRLVVTVVWAATIVIRSADADTETRHAEVDSLS
jgi:hypothetical protein